MYTQCPQCLTIYEIDEDALQASLGIVRCGHCSERFDALRTLSDSLPVDADTTLAEHATEALTPTLTEAISPDVIEAAARRQRKRADPATSTASATPAAETAAPRPEDTWFAPLAGELTRALIADAAGIPQDAILGDPAWQVTDLPIQMPLAELGGTSATPDPVVPEDGSDASATDEERIPATAGSEPFGKPWSLEIPVPDRPAASVDLAQPDIAELPKSAELDVDDPQLGETAVAATAGEVTESDPLADQTFADAPNAEATLPGDTCLTRESAPEPSGAGFDDDAAPSEPGAAATTAPVYVPPRRRRFRRSEGLWASGCLVLALVLAAQVAWAQRVALVRDPATQAWMLHLCASLDCHLPPIRDVAKLELLSRDIRPDPAAAGALMITATVRNGAAFRQPWPVVVVELADLDNEVVAMRRFRPAEYMPNPARRAAGIAPGTTAAVAFEVADPGKRAVSFHFGFE